MANHKSVAWNFLAYPNLDQQKTNAKALMKKCTNYKLQAPSGTICEVHVSENNGKNQQGFPSLNIMKLQLRLLKRFFYRDRPFSVTLRSCDLWLLTKSDTLMFSVDQRWAEILKAAQRLPRSGTARCAGTACIRRATNSSSCWGIAGQPIWWVNIWNLLVCGCLFPKILSYS